MLLEILTQNTTLESPLAAIDGQLLLLPALSFPIALGARSAYGSLQERLLPSCSDKR